MSHFFIETKLPNRPSLFRRIVAFTIDLLVSLAIALLINIYWGQAFRTDINFYSRKHLGMDFLKLVEIYGDLNFVCALTFILIFFRDLIGGRSLGKKIMNLVIVHKTACKNARYARTFLRSIIPFATMIGLVFFLIKTEYMLIVLVALACTDLVLLSTQPNHRGLGDFLAGTVVMIERRGENRE